MPEIQISAEQRTEFGKGAARRIRRAAKVPAVLYGHGTDPVHIALPGHATMLALKSANALLAIDLDGRQQLALPKDVQRDPIKGFIEHVDLLVVNRGERVVVDVPVHVVGEAGAEAVVTVEHQTLQVEAEATSIPDGLEVSVEGLEAGTQVSAAEVALPAGAVLAGDPEATVVNVVAAVTAEALEADLAATEAELGIEHDAPQETGEGAAEEPAGAAEAGAADASDQDQPVA